MTRRHLPAFVQLLALSLLCTLTGCSEERPESEYFRPGNELTRWTRGRMSDKVGLLVRVDPDFEHEGSPWLDGVDAEEWTEAELKKSEEGTLYLELWGSDGFQGYIVSFKLIDDDPGLEVGVSHYNDVVIGANRPPYTPTIPGRVRLSTLEWTAGEPVHFEFGLHVLGHDRLRSDDEDGYYFLRGSATALPKPEDQ